jgi:endo-1,4-beta-xylanase
MKKYPAILLVVIILASCVPPNTSVPVTPTIVPTIPPTVTSAPTFTPIPLVTVTGRAILSSYPGMDPCSVQTVIPIGTQVTVLGTYKDFVAVAFQNGTALEQGFLPKETLSLLPAGIPELSPAQVPWKSVVDYSAWSYYSPENGGEIKVSPSTEEQGDWATDPTQHPVPVPLRIHFGLQATGTSWAAVKLIGTPEDATPWWQGIVRMDVSIDPVSYGLCVRDGSTEGCTADIPVPIPPDQEITFLFLDSNGKRLQVLDAMDTVVKEIDFTSYPGLNLPNGLFPNGWFQFGTTVGTPETLIVSPLSITTPPSGLYEPSWLTEPGLTELAAPRGILIGTEFGPDMMTDERYCAAIRHDFNLGAISAFSDANLWLGPGDYNFAVLDQIVNDSAAYGLTLYASHLVWGSYDTGAFPDWLKNGHYSKEELLTILKNHITTVVSRYKDKVKIWSIANEAPERDRSYGADFWFDHIGPEYVQKSFEWARQADPNAILLLNSANNESPRDADTIYNINTLYRMVSTMKENGVPIDVVGMQMHLFLPWTSHVMPTEADVEATMKKFGDLGVKVMITEMDVNLHEIPGTAQEKAAVQVQLYSDMMTACINSGVCTVFATWGVSDLTSWISTADSKWVYQTHTPDAAPLLFDTEYQPKPAYFALLNVLRMPR